MASTETKQPTEVEDEDEEDIDEEQLEEYREMVENLGDFPDKVKISSLSMVAEDFSESRKAAQTVYNVIRERIMKGSQRKLLPLVYLVDSILKNAKGHFIKIIEADAEQWLPHVFQQLQEAQKVKLQKVWKTWGDTELFDSEKLKDMGRCFDKGASKNTVNHSTSTEVAGISRTSDGSLILSKTLRQEMQNILDDMQSDVNEVDKISLERLAQINPSLLAKVKATALEGLGGDGDQKGNTGSHRLQGAPGRSVGNNAPAGAGRDDETTMPRCWNETRTPQQVKRAKAWSDIKDKTRQDASKLVEDLVERVEKCGEEQYTQLDAMAMTQYMAAASAAVQLLKSTMERIRNESDQKKNAMLLTANVTAPSGSLSTVQAQIADPSQFTNEGLKKKNAAIISMLYEVGLPFVSSADGRRFRTQLELSNHLDGLFKRNQLEKSIAKTEERGWYEADVAWAGEAKQADMEQLAAAVGDILESGAIAAQGGTEPGDGYSPETSTVPADEARDRCVVCGLNFKMEFDNDDGIYKYTNCREIELMNDEIALNDSEQCLVHVTCWRGLGSPSFLTADQAMQEVLS